MERTIGIKVADGSLYPVLEDGFYGDKRLIVTTIRDNQSEVHIDLYRGDAAAGVAASSYIGSLIIENIVPAPKGSPDIEVVMGASVEGNLNVSATDRTTGEEQSLSVSLRAGEAESELELPDFELEVPEEPGTMPETPEAPAQPIEPRGAGLHARAEELRAERTQAPRRSVAAIVLVAILALIVLGAAAYVVYRTLFAPGEPEAPVVPAPVATQPVSKAAEPTPAPAKAPEPAITTRAAASEPAALAGSERGVRYRIKWGDTLWDLSSTYYRDPWLYPRIARANSIRNPDLIFAGTTIFIPER